MESNTFTLSKPLRNRIQGLVGELVALDYVRENLKIDFGDKVIITTNRCNKLQTKQSATKNPMVAYFYTVYKSPFDFLRHAIVDNFHQTGCEGIDFVNSDIEAKDLFDKNISKTKKQITFDLERLYMGYRKAREERIKEQKEIYKNAKIDNAFSEKDKTMIFELVNTLSHEDLAKILTIIELEKNREVEKERGLSISVSEFKISSLIQFKNYFLQRMAWAERDYEKRRNTINIISEHANAKFEIWKIFSSVFNCLNLTKNKPDIMILHCHGKKLNKLILIECKSGDADLSPNQNDCIDCIKKIKTDKVGYEKINVDYRLPEKLTVSEISYIP